MNAEEEQVSMFGPDGSYGKMCQAHSAQELPKGRTFASSSRRSSELKAIPFMSLDLTPGHGNLLGESYWEMNSPWRGGSSTLNTGPAPLKEEDVFSLSQILQDDPPRKYYLSKAACLGILRRAEQRGKELPVQLEMAVKVQAGLLPLTVFLSEPTAFTANAAAFNAGAGPSASTIGWQEECAPTLKGSPSGNMMPTVFCLNDQGGSIMDCSKDVAGTLRSQEHGHQPLVLYENHGKDARYKGPLRVAPTVVTTYGTGGNNLPLVGKELYSRQRVDKFKFDDVASTESARQHKDTTDLVCQPTGTPLLIRRLTPLECERLQGYPDGFTDLSGASDSARYRALGNSVCIPCVEYIMQGIAMAAG